MTETPPVPRIDLPDDLQEPLAPAPGCRLCVATLGDAESGWCASTLDELDRPRFRGVPVLGSDGIDLAVIGHGVDGVLRAWRGQPADLGLVGPIDVDMRPVSLVRHLDRWHLFGVDPDGRPWHGSSLDLARWMVDDQFADEHPLFKVRGAVSMLEGIVVLGEVISNDRRIGWTLLEGSLDRYRPREIAVTIMADHEVAGPVRLSDDDMAVVYSSGTSHLAARTVAGTRWRNWTVSPLAPHVAPAVPFAYGPQVWVVGTDPSEGTSVIAALGGQAIRLTPSAGIVCAATVHGTQVVLARFIDVDAVASPIPAAVEVGAGSGALTAQSSSAYSASGTAA